MGVFLIGITFLIAFIVLGFYFYALGCVIVRFKYYRCLMKYLKKRGMEYDLDYLNIRNVNNIRGKYELSEKRKNYLTKITDDIKLNHFKNDVYKLDVRINKLQDVVYSYGVFLGLVVIPIIIFLITILD